MKLSIQNSTSVSMIVCAKFSENSGFVFWDPIESASLA